MNRFDLYLRELEETQKLVAARNRNDKSLEHPHRPALKKLLELMLPGVIAVNEPGKDDRGAVDFALMQSGYPIGYVEAKAIGEDLNKIAKSDQLSRYYGYANLILTNHLEFRFFKNGKEYENPIVIADNFKFIPDQNSCVLLETTFKTFLKDAAEPVHKASHLAKIMGEHGKRIATNLLRFLNSDTIKNAAILEIFDAFKSELIHDLSFEAFADMYAQTLVYGLFVARYYDESSKDFSRTEALELIPISNPLLRRFFVHIAGSDFDKRLQPIVDDLCKVFGSTDVKALMQQIYEQDLWGTEHLSPDPVIHFYEDFLKEYDPKERKALGAYYTPPPVVQFIVRSIDAILKRDFELTGGIADTKKISHSFTIQGKKTNREIHQVQVLDPAVGTGTFLNEVIRMIRKSFVGQEGRFQSYVIDDLMPRLHGFEIMMAPYTIAHLKLSATFKESGAGDLENRLGIYLTNSLEKGIENEATLFGPGFGKTISEESRNASKIKNETPIMVVIGNPPYSGESSNKEYMGNNVYRFEPGTTQKLKERNSKWINDDYVKFIRFAESLIEKTGEGVVGMITAHGYLDNPTFRGMRYHLMQTFSEIYVLDLHGNSNKKEKAPDGSKDENVFAIKQGVAILIGVRRKGKRSSSLATVYRADCYGTKRAKFECLREMELGSMHWHELDPKATNYEWVVRDEKARKGYEAGFSLDELFPISSVGVVTSRDGFVVDMDKGTLSQRVQSFLASSTPQEALTKFGLKENLKWKAANALKHQYDEERLVPVSYRPFDSRFIYYHDDFIERSRVEVMQYFLGKENIGLVTNRRIEGPRSFADVFITDCVMDARRVSLKETNFVFPLYADAEDGSRQPNLNRDITKQIASSIGEEPTPEDIFDYIYAVLHSPKYRERYNELLKVDFPHVPYPKDRSQFEALVAFGKQLRELHLLESSAVRTPITTYPGGGTNKIEKSTRKGDSVYINETQYFGNVPEIAWTFHIGGYQPAQKWLKDRVGRILTNGEIEHYQKIIVALVETDRIMKEIDKVVQF